MERNIGSTYQLQVKGNVKMLNLVDSFATTGIYRLAANGYNSVRPELEEYVLEEEEVKVTDYFDPNTYQIIEYVNKLARIYDRQHVCVDKDGLIKGLLNLPEIKGKWDALKRELLQINPIGAFEVIKQKDRELAKPVEVIENLSNTHFMHLFLYAFAVKQGDEERKQQHWVRDRMGIGFLLPVIRTFRQEESPEGYTVYAEATLDNSRKMEKARISEVTGQEELEIKHHMHAHFVKDAGGVLVAAEMNIYEQLNSEYTSDLYLQLKSL